ncbi:MAG: amidohydrolase family protein [Pirellulaceae bacterium]|nr:amidohydrolase family protein [Pirellulaceae bacterium]
MSYAATQRVVWLGILLAVGLPPVLAQQPDTNLPLDGRDGRKLLLENFRPQPMLRVPRHELARAKFPVVDVHTHFRVKFRGGGEQLEEWVRLMDRNQVAVCVSLDGQWDDALDEHASFLWAKHQDRFAIFANIDWQGRGRADDPGSWDCQRPDFARRVAQQLAAAKERGACGLKIFKQFGLEYRNPDGSPIQIDDPRWDGIWRACGELGLPVLIHVADPAAFFLPIDERNERWEELHRRPDWSYHGPQFPQREAVLADFLRVVERHPKTTFIGAHVAGNAEDLATVGEWLEKHPNLHVEIASRIAELGRQPYTARRFVIMYQDRILFGTDGPWPEERLRLYWRFLETEDENFPYSEKDFPPQGLWNIYGLHLPDDVLRKLYSENAARLLPSVAAKLARLKLQRK